jgi:hypothetical protein
MVVHPTSHGIPRVPQYSGSTALDSGFRIRGFHSLRPAFPCRSPNPCLDPPCPLPRQFSLPVWPPPLSLATTRGISFDFFSSPYLDVSVRAVPRICLCVQHMLRVYYLARVSPFGNLRINGYLLLPAAYRSLSRPSSAPGAKAFPLRPF